ncbi:MAG TPA: hypothetical protein PLQ93_10670 [Bacteroidia bacterium]|nr:hypothetical protein [Bacteroidia bacterium]
MVNNHLREAGEIPPLFFVLHLPGLLLLFFCLNTAFYSAQNINSYYVSSRVDKGSIYFIRAQKGFKSKPGANKLRYDMTYLLGKDSVTFNFSYFDKKPIVCDSLVLINGSKRLSSALSKIFIETKGKKWHYRYGAKFSFKDTQAFFNPEQEALMLLICKNAVVELHCKKRLWKKHAGVNTRIFELINLNR